MPKTKWYSNPYHDEIYQAQKQKDKIDNEIIYAMAKKWEGWGTALKPALEPITVARKPLGEKTVAENCLKWGVGGINIDGCRIGYTDGTTEEQIRRKYTGSNEGNGSVTNNFGVKDIKMTSESTLTGRFPANLIHDGSDEVVGLFPQTGKSTPVGFKKRNDKDWGMKHDIKFTEFNDSGSAARFFYCAKASKSERNRGCEDMEEKQTVGGGGGIGNYLDDVNSASGKYGSEKAPSKNNHPTVKPIALMEYLVKLVSKEGHTVLDPFMGSGSTGIACKKLGREFIGIEKESDYCKIAEARIGAVQTVQEKLYD